jgi:hypothetical protein
MVAVPGPSAVTSPVDELTAATVESLERQVARLVRFWVAGEPEAYVPMATNWAVSPTTVTACVLGMMAIELSPVEVLLATLIVAVPLMIEPFWACAEAVIVAVPAPTAVATPVATPLELTMAMLGALEIQAA